MATIYTLARSPSTVVEGNQVTFTISRSGDKPAETIYFSTISGTASYAAGDYTMSSGGEPKNIAVTFAAGVTLKTVTINIRTDGVSDSGEQFHAIVQARSTDPISTALAVSGKITINDMSYSLGPASKTVTEGNVSITFTVTRNGDLLAQTLYASTLHDSASSPGDYDGLVNKALVFGAGDATETFTVWINEDSLVEATEHFRVMIGKNASDGSSQAVAISDVYIEDDDTATPPPPPPPPPAGDTVREGSDTTHLLANNGSVSGTIDQDGMDGANPAIDKDWYRLSLSAGTQYVLAASATVSSSDTLDAVAIRIYDGSGAALAPDRTADGAAPSITFTPTAGGTYYAAISAGGAGTFQDKTGAYQISLTSGGSPPPPPPPPGGDEVREGTDTQHGLTATEVGGSRIDAEPISGDGTVSDGAGGMVDKDWYKVTLEKGYVYQFGASTTNMTTGSVAINLYFDASNKLFTAPKEGATPVFTFDTTNQASALQTYYLAVSAGGAEGAWQKATGDYAVNFGKTGGTTTPPLTDDYRDEDTDTSAPLGEISVRNPVQTGFIGSPDSNDLRGDKDVFKITLIEGQTYYFEMTGQSGGGASALPKSIFTIRRDGSFNTILSSSTDGPTATMEYYAAIGGDYFIRTGAGGATFSTDQGAYKLEMRTSATDLNVTEPGSTLSTALPVTLTNGKYAYSGTVGAGDPSDLFVLTLPNSGRLSLSLTGLTADVDMRILDSSGRDTQFVSENDLKLAESISADLVANQKIYIKVFPGTVSAGNYSLAASFVPDPPPQPNPAKGFDTLVGDHAARTLAKFAVAAYEDGGYLRDEIRSVGWRLYSGTDSATGPEAELINLLDADGFYRNINAAAIVARSADAIVISFRGTDQAIDRLHWVYMQDHYRLFAPLLEAVGKIIDQSDWVKQVYVTGHSLGAAMVDLFMNDNPDAVKQPSGRYVSFDAVTLAHPDVFGNPLKFEFDGRITSFHNQNDPINLFDLATGRIPGIESSIRYTSDAGVRASHDKFLYLHGITVLSQAGINDALLRAEIGGRGKNNFLVPGPNEGENNQLSSRHGALLMVGGRGNDVYSVVAQSISAGDTIIEEPDATGAEGIDTLRILSGGGGMFNGNVRIALGRNGTDLFVYPVTSFYSTDLNPIRLFHFFQPGRGLEFIQWEGHYLALPATPAGIDGWNAARTRNVNVGQVLTIEGPTGAVTHSIDASGGLGSGDTAHLQLKGGVAANLDFGIGELLNGFRVEQKSVRLFSVSDTVSVQASDDRVIIDLGNIEHIIGSDYDDVLLGNAQANALDGGDGNDELAGAAGNDTLYGGEGSDVLQGGPDADRLLGGPGGDILDGGSGDDFLFGGIGTNSLIGGLGDDTFFVDDASDTIVEFEGEGAGDRVLTSVSFRLAPGVHVEALSTVDDAGTASIDLTGNELNNRIVGNAGANQLSGGDGNDLLIGGDGDDSMDGGDGNDTFIMTGISAGGGARSMTLQPGPEGQDLWVTNVYYGGGADDGVLKVGGWADLYNSLIRFDLAAGGLPASVGSATLRLYNTGNNGGTPTGFFVDQLGTAWTEAYRWNDYTLAYTNLTQVAAPAVGWVEIDITQAVNAWLANPGSNFGLQLRPTSNNNNFDFFVSSDATGDNVSKRPQILFNWMAAAITGPDADTALGGPGNDVYILDSAGDRVIEAANEGTDEIRTALGAYSLEAIENVENLTGTSASGQLLTGNGLGNVLFGGMGDDTLVGLAGDDILIGFGGSDILRGGAGNDVYIIDAGDTIVELAGDGIDEVRTQASIFVLADALENLRATTDIGHDFRGNAGNNVIVGGDGNDIIRLQDGGGDLVFGKGGVDSFYFGRAFGNDDFVDGGGNRDSLILQGNYDVTLTWAITGASSIANIESISLVSGATATFGDTANNRYSYKLTFVDGNIAAGALMKVNGFHLLAGESLTIDASAETDAPLQIFGGLGREALKGGAQGDAFVFGHDGRFGAGDKVDGGGGYDVVYLRGDYAIDFNAAEFAGSLTNVESIALLTSANTEFVAGGDGDFDYSIVWNDAMLAAGATLTVNGSRLQEFETFVFDGSRETNGALRLFGGGASDILIGGGGADQIQGGGGGDLLRGGGGADLFRYSATTESVLGASDTIEGFVAGQDKIDLGRIDARSATADNEAFAYIGAAAFSGAGPGGPGEVRAVFISGSLWRIEADVNGDARADLFIEVHVTGGGLLTQGDFIL